MTTEQLFEAIGMADERYIRKAEEWRPARHPVWIRWVSLAACLVLVVVVGVAAWTFAPPTTATHVPDEYEIPHLTKEDAHPFEDGGRMVYAVPPSLVRYAHGPRTGEIVYDIPYELSTFAPTDLLWVAIALYDGNDQPCQKSERETEAKRLADLGYEIYTYDERWTGYWGEEKQYTHIAAVMSVEQLRQFPASEQYAYSFTWVSEPKECFTRVE